MMQRLRAAVHSLFPPGVPRAQLLPLLLLQLCESYASSSVVAYCGYLVLDLVPGVDERTAGNYSGLLASAFFACQFLSSPVFGALSDRFGRKPLLLLGTGGNFLSTMLLGFSFNFPWAVVARALNGTLNGNIATLKAFASDLTSTAAQRNAVFSNLLLFSGLGSILGGAIGGALARPAVQYPDAFSQTGIFGKFPYLLPNLVCAVLLATAFVLSCFFVKDARSSNSKAKQSPPPTTNTTPPPSSSSLPSTTEPATSEAEQEESLVSRPEARRKPRRSPKCVCLSVCELVKPGRRISLAVCGLYALFGFANTVYRAALPVWAMAPCESGGISFSARQTGLVFTVAGFMVIPIQMFLYPAVVRRLRLLWCFRIGGIMLVLAYLFTPLLSKLCASSSAWMWTAIGAVSLLWMGGAQLGFAAINTLINNSAPLGLSGVVNGAAQSFVALGRTVGPVSFSPLLAWTLSNGHGFPLNAYFTFLITSVIPLVSGLLSFFLPTTLNAPKAAEPAVEEPVEEEAEESRVELDALAGSDHESEREDDGTPQSQSSAVI